MRAFILTFNTSIVNRQTMINAIDKMDEIKNWHASLESAIFIASDKTAKEISTLIHNKFPILYFFIAELPRGYNDGYLPQKCWDFINNPKPVQAESILNQFTNGIYGNYPNVPPKLPTPPKK